MFTNVKFCIIIILLIKIAKGITQVSLHDIKPEEIVNESKKETNIKSITVAYLFKLGIDANASDYGPQIVDGFGDIYLNSVSVKFVE